MNADDSSWRSVAGAVYGSVGTESWPLSIWAL